MQPFHLLNSWLSPHCPVSLSQVTAVKYGSHQQITRYVLPGAWLLVLPTWSLKKLPRFINDELRRKTNKRKTGEGVIYTAECGPGALTTLLCVGVVGKAVSVVCRKFTHVRTLWWLFGLKHCWEFWTATTNLPELMFAITTIRSELGSSVTRSKSTYTILHLQSWDFRAVVGLRNHNTLYRIRSNLLFLNLPVQSLCVSF
jgi:hypothetical protein